MTERAKKLLLLYYKQSRKIRRVSGLPPLTFKAKKAGTLKNYRIYGQTVDGESVGDRTANLFDMKKFAETAYPVNATIEYSENSLIFTATKTDAFVNQAYSQLPVPPAYRPSCIDVQPLTTYTISMNTPYKCFISWINDSFYPVDSYTNIPNNQSSYTFTTPEGCTKLLFRLGKEVTNIGNIFTISNIMLNEGSTALPYEAYGYKVPVTVKGKNLFDGELTDGYHLSDTTGLPVSFARRFATLQPITINQSEYCLTYNSTTDLCFMYSVFNNDTLIRRAAIVNNRYLQSGDAIDTTGGNKIYFAFYNNDYSHASTGMISNIMLNTGSTPLPYEPYHAPVTTSLYLPEPIKIVGDEAEYVDYGAQKMHRVRKNLVQTIATSQTINDITFTVNANGSVTCNGTNHGNNPIMFELNNPDVVFPEGVYITSGCPAGGSITGGYKIQYFNGSGWNYELGSGSTFTLSGNLKYRSRILISKDVTVTNLTFYPMLRLASIEDDTYEPYIENTDLDVTLPALPTLSGTNTLSVGTEVQPSKVEIKGKIKAVQEGSGENEGE